MRGQIAYLIEKQCAFVGRFDAPDVCLKAPVNAPRS